MEQIFSAAHSACGIPEERNSILGNSPLQAPETKQILGQSVPTEREIGSPNSGLAQGYAKVNDEMKHLVVKNVEPVENANFSPTFTQVFHSKSSSAVRRGEGTTLALHKSPQMSLNSGHAHYSGSPIEARRGMAH